MNKSCMRLMSVVLVLSMLLGGVVPGAFAENETAEEPLITHVPTYENTYVNTGNQRLDILGVALTQMGYTEGENNDTKYGSWYGLPCQYWCAMFVVWCARQADISEDIIVQTGSVPTLRYNLRVYDGSYYTPKPGDIFITSGNSHTGLVYYVDGEYFYTIEGNANTDHSYDGYYVVTNKRKISTHKFGVPAYKGCDGEHTYVRGQESAHPHRNYYECQDCGDFYYTGSTGCVSDCSSCIPGYSRAEAGYYLCNVSGVYLPMRSGAGYSYSEVGGVQKGQVVYVHGTSYGWGYIEHDNLRGYVKMSNLKKYVPAPEAPVISAQKTEYRVDDTIQIAWDPVENNEIFRLQLCRGETLLRDLDLGTDTSYTMQELPAGQYELRLSAANKTGSSDACVFSFVVRNIFDVTYDTRGGSPTPEAQTKVFSQDLTLRSDIPVREGYTFLGWTDQAEGTCVAYRAGGTLSVDEDVTLYAVWKADDAVAQSLQIHQMPRRTMFVLGEELDTTGLALLLTYSDGSAEIITEGYTAEGFASDTVAALTVTVTYSGVTASYDVEVVTYIPGDFNEDRFVTEDDAIYLLQYVLFSETFPISIPGDFTADGQITEDDAIYLLQHVLFAELFPLNQTGE